jgi:DNA-binding response OmpR family regulator
MRVLLTEDDPEIARVVAKGLREHGYAVDIAGDGERALYNAEVNSYDVVLLDVRLPRKDGFSVCRELREKSFHAPILLLTAMDDAEDVICGLNCGADDYVTKPFDLPVLLARVHALLRRAQLTKPETMAVEDLTLNPQDHTASRGGRPILRNKSDQCFANHLLHPRRG